MTETWYEVEVSSQGEDDWVKESATRTYDTQQEADRLVKRTKRRGATGWDYRIVRVTCTREVMA